MTRQPDIQYVQFSIDGTAARKLDQRRSASHQQKRNPQRSRAKQKYKEIQVDPLAIGAMVLAGVMLIIMAVGMLQIGMVNAQTVKMEQYISTLQEENIQLQAEYDESFDVEEVRQKALAMGLVPRQDSEQITISVQVPTQQEEQSVWDQIGTFLAGLFA